MRQELTILSDGKTSDPVPVRSRHALLHVETTGTVTLYMGVAGEQLTASSPLHEVTGSDDISLAGMIPSAMFSLSSTGDITAAEILWED